MKRKYETEMDDASSIEPDDGKTTFSDLCDHVIDMIMCDLELVDLVNISDTSTRLRGIAASVFSRKYAHRWMCINAEHHATLPISGADIRFKLLRNFGASIKYLRISNRGDDTKILSALQKLSKYISEYCYDSLEILDLEECPYFTLSKPLTKLKEFHLFSKCINNSLALELMPNLRSLSLATVPKSIAKYHGKLERVRLLLGSDEEVQTFISFLQLNRQIKYLRLSTRVKRRPEDTVSIYSSIADNLTQLKTLKILDYNEPEVDYQFRLDSVESFSIGCAHTRFPFQFNDLKKLTLLGNRPLSSPYCMDFVLRNRKLKILKIYSLFGTFLNGFHNVLNELPELEQIAVFSAVEQQYSILKNILGTEWKEFEKTGRRSSLYYPLYKRFRKVKSAT